MEQLYTVNDPVTILGPRNVNAKRQLVWTPQQRGQRQGFIKCYATWCPHCRDKVREINRLARAADPEVNMYVLEASEHQQPADLLGVRSYPTFFAVSASGQVQQQPMDYDEVRKQLKRAARKPVSKSRGRGQKK